MQTPRLPLPARAPEIWSTLERLMLSLLAKKPTKRPTSGNVVALELFEEAERAHRLWRINPEVRRSGSPGLVDLPPLRTVTVGGLSGELDPANLAGHVDVGTVAPQPAEPPDSELPQMSGTTGSWPSSLRDLLQSFRSSRRPSLGANSHPVARQLLTETLAAPFAITPRRAGSSLRSLPGIPPRRRTAAGDSPAATNRCPECGPRAAFAGDGLAVMRRAVRRGDRAQQRTAR